ncbi:MAG: tetratricopeptide repeat protein [Opitutales bacterium]
MQPLLQFPAFSSARPVLGLRAWCGCLALFCAGLGLHGAAGADPVDAGYAALDADDPARALASFEEALAGGNKSVEARLGHGMALAENGYHGRAETAFKEVTRRQPDHALAWNRKGVAQYNQHRFQQAARSLERAVSLRPTEGFFHESLAWALLCEGQTEAAVRSALQAMLIYEESGEDPAFSLLLAWYGFRRMGDQAEADKIVTFARNRLNPVVWPFPLFAYFGGLIDADSMIVEVTDRHQETEARAYLAARAILDQQPMEALPHLHWIRKRGSQRVFEQVWAETLLNDLEDPGPTGAAARIDTPAADDPPSG